MPRKARHRTCATALTIAGSDSGGGAGIQADLKTFAALGVHGTCAITCVTAQNPTGVFGVQATRREILRLQLSAVFTRLRPGAVKTGMLYSAALIEETALWAGRERKAFWVVDPVMVATSGARLLKPKAVESLCARLLPHATLVTPNVDEAQYLTGIEIRSIDDLRRAARQLQSLYGCAVLAKGGHLDGPEATDILWDGRSEVSLSVPRTSGVSSHGTGCTYSAAIAGYLALGHSLIRSVSLAKEYITSAIRNSERVGAHFVLNHFPKGLFRR